MLETDDRKIGLLSLCDSHATKVIHKLNHPDSAQPELLIIAFPNPAPHVQLHLIAPTGETIPVVMLPQEARRIGHSLEEAADKAEQSADSKTNMTDDEQLRHEQALRQLLTSVDGGIAHQGAR